MENDTTQISFSGLLNEITIVATSSRLTTQFIRGLKHLSKPDADKVGETYRQWRKNPSSVIFERKFSNIYAVEVTRKIKAICEINGSDVLWIWISYYTSYYTYLNSLRKGR